MNEKKTPNQFHEITFHFAWILYRFLCIFYYPSVSANCKGGYDGWGFSENEKNTSSDMLDIWKKKCIMMKIIVSSRIKNQMESATNALSVGFDDDCWQLYVTMVKTRKPLHETM